MTFWSHRDCFRISWPVQVKYFLIRETVGNFLRQSIRSNDAIFKLILSGVYGLIYILFPNKYNIVDSEVNGFRNGKYYKVIYFISIVIKYSIIEYINNTVQKKYYNISLNMNILCFVNHFKEFISWGQKISQK